jgi:hypothetical protein
MPWCEDCSRFYTPSTLTAEGDCPEGHHVADPDEPPALVQSGADPREDEPTRAPWHFWVLVAAVAVYLGWRLVQGIGLLVG